MNNELKIVLSVESRIYQALQLDDDDILSAYEMVRVKRGGSRCYFEATAKGWRRVVEDLRERANGGWDPDCAISRSTALRMRDRVEKAIAAHDEPQGGIKALSDMIMVAFK